VVVSSLNGAIEEIEADGRRLRREANRAAVVDALLGWYRDGVLDPSAEQVAERAGLSARSVFRYFDHADDLCRAAIDRQMAAVAHLLVLPDLTGRPLAERAEVVADRTVALFEEVAPVARVSRLRAPFQPIVAQQIARARRAHRRQLAAVFAPELARLGASGDSVLSAADALTSFESYDLLRTTHRHSRAAVVAVLRTGLAALFT
jgi:TetR/AcrR family transcriptional regulator of autoinduction and epiphytic fitness